MGYLDEQGNRIETKKKKPRILDESGNRMAEAAPVDPRADWASTADPRIGSGKVEYDVAEPARRAVGHLAEVPERTLSGLKSGLTPSFMKEYTPPAEDESILGGLGKRAMEGFNTIVDIVSLGEAGLRGAGQFVGEGMAATSRAAADPKTGTSKVNLPFFGDVEHTPEELRELGTNLGMMGAAVSTSPFPISRGVGRAVAGGRKMGRRATATKAGLPAEEATKFGKGEGPIYREPIDQKTVRDLLAKRLQQHGEAVEAEGARLGRTLTADETAVMGEKMYPADEELVKLFGTEAPAAAAPKILDEAGETIEQAVKPTVRAPAEGRTVSVEKVRAKRGKGAGKKAQKAKAKKPGRTTQETLDQILEGDASRMNIPKKGWEDQAYRKAWEVEVTFPDGTKHTDTIAGLNRSHAMDSALDNWEGAAVQLGKETPGPGAKWTAEQEWKAYVEDITVGEHRLPIAEDTLEAAGTRGPGLYSVKGQGLFPLVKKTEEMMDPVLRAALEEKGIIIYEVPTVDLKSKRDPSGRATVAMHTSLGDTKAIVRWNEYWLRLMPPDLSVSTTVHELVHAATKKGLRLSPAQTRELFSVNPGMEKVFGQRRYMEDQFSDELFARLMEMRVRARMKGYVPPGAEPILKRFNEMMDNGLIVQRPAVDMFGEMDRRFVRGGKSYEASRLDPDTPLTGKELEEMTLEDRIKRVTNVETEKLARLYNLTADDLKAMQGMNASEIVQIVGDASARGARVLDAIHSGDFKETVRAVDHFMSTELGLAAARAEPGRATQIWKRLRSMQTKIEVIQEVSRKVAMLDPNDPRSIEIIQGFLADIGKTEDILRRPLSMGEKIHSVWINSIMSRPWMHVTNAVSNTSFLAIRPLLVRPFEAAIEATKSVATLGAYKRKAFFGEAWADASGQLSALRDANSRAWKTWATGESIFPSTRKMEFFRGELPGRAGRLAGAPGRGMTMSDEFFKVLSYQGSKNAQWYKARMRGMPTDPKELIALKNRIETTALEEAARTTYTNKLPKFFATIGESRRYTLGGVGKWIVPFYNTPVNVMLSTFEHTPGLGYLAASTTGGEAFSATSKQLAGMTAGLGAYLMVSAAGGEITGGGPLEASAKKVWMMENRKPYTVKFPGMNPISYRDWTGLFGVMALIGDATDMAEEGFLDMSDVVFRFGKTLVNAMANPAFPTGLSNFMDATENEYGAKKFVQNMASSLVPGIVKSAGEAYDPTVRRAVNPDWPGAGMGEGMMAGIPGMQEEVPVLYNHWGLPVIRSSGILQMLGLQDNQDPNVILKPINEEITRVMRATGGGIGGVADDLGGIPLTGPQYEKYAKRAGELAQQKVPAMMVGGIYENLKTDEQKLTKIREAFTEARAQAKKELLRTDKELKAQIKAEVRKNRPPKYGGSKALKAIGGIGKGGL